MTSFRHVTESTYKVLCVVGARPNFIKMAPIIDAFAQHVPAIETVLVHTGQHYGASMNAQYFTALGLPEPAFNLGVGSGSHAVQTADIMRGFEPVLDSVAPDAVLVVGDVNSTLACALVAKKKGVPVIHVEAGLRSFDRTMPEEINRILTDQLSDLLLTSETTCDDNLRREGIDQARIHLVGNVMIDSLQQHLAQAVPVQALLASAGRSSVLAAGNGHAVFTAHRPSNVDDAVSLQGLLGLLRAIADRLPVIFPMHPRTHAMVTHFGLHTLLDHPAIVVTEPQGYLEMLGLMKTARMVVTDSGGMQEEATVLGVPCITLRDTTERPATLECGGNVLVAQDRDKALGIVDAVLQGGYRPHRVPPLWDGHAGTRIAQATYAWFKQTLRSPSSC